MRMCDNRMRRALARIKCVALKAAYAPPPETYNQVKEINEMVELIDGLMLDADPLTDEEIRQIDSDTHFHESRDWSVRFAKAIERKHGIGTSE